MTQFIYVLYLNWGVVVHQFEILVQAHLHAWNLTRYIIVWCHAGIGQNPIPHQFP